MAKVTVSYKIPRGTYKATLDFTHIHDAKHEAVDVRGNGLFVKTKNGDYIHVAPDEILSVTISQTTQGEKIAGAYNHAD